MHQAAGVPVPTRNYHWRSICHESGQAAGHSCNLLSTVVHAQAAAARRRVSAKATTTGAIGPLHTSAQMRALQANASAALQQIGSKAQTRVLTCTLATWRLEANLLPHDEVPHSVLLQIEGVTPAVSLQDAATPAMARRLRPGTAFEELTCQSP